MVKAKAFNLIWVGILFLAITVSNDSVQAQATEGARGTGNIVGISSYKWGGDEWTWLITDTGELWRWRYDLDWVLKGTWPSSAESDEYDGIVGTGNIVGIGAYKWDADDWVWLMTDTGELWRWRNDLGWAQRDTWPGEVSADGNDRALGTGNIIGMNAYKVDAREWVWLITDTGELWRWRDDLGWVFKGTWPGESSAQEFNWSQLKTQFGR